MQIAVRALSIKNSFYPLTHWAPNRFNRQNLRYGLTEIPLKNWNLDYSPRRRNGAGIFD